jgi:hypothetical protein
MVQLKKHVEDSSDSESDDNKMATASESEKGDDESSVENDDESSVEEEDEDEPNELTVTGNGMENESGGSEKCTFDLRNLLAINSHQVDSSALYNAMSVDGEDCDIEIPGANINEEHLLDKARESCTQLVAALWELPTERSDAGPMAVLPKGVEIKTPRELVSFNHHRY